MTRIRLDWIPRPVPLAYRAVVATGAAARSLGRRLAALDDAALGSLAAVAGADVLVVIGAELPWVDGVTYLGRDDAAPDLLLPTALAPTIPVRVLEQAIRAVVPGAGPVAVLPARLIPCRVARAIDRDRLLAWLEAA